MAYSVSPRTGGFQRQTSQRLSSFLKVASLFDEAIWLNHMRDYDPTYGEGFEKLVNHFATRTKSRPGVENGIFYLTAELLLAFCWLALLRCIERGLEFRRCAACEVWYTGRRTGRRRGDKKTEPKFCSPRCKDRWHDLGMADAVERDWQLRKEQLEAKYSFANLRR